MTTRHYKGIPREHLCLLLRFEETSQKVTDQKMAKMQNSYMTSSEALKGSYAGE